MAGFASRHISINIGGSIKGLQKAAGQGEKALGGWRGQFQRFNRVAVAASLAVAAGALKLGKDLFVLSNRMKDLDIKSKAVFKDNLPAMQRWAQENKRSMGLSARETLGLAANFADLLIPMGFATDKAAEMSREVTELAPALAKWTGGTRTAAEVQAILAKAMLGEREGLKELGISITQAEVDARVLADGNDHLTGTQLQQAKATATQALIFEKSTDAQAAWANGGKEAAERQNSLNVSIQEIKESLAKALTPAFEAGAKIAEQFAGIMERNTGAVKGAVAAIGGLAALVLGVNAAMKVAKATMLLWHGALKLSGQTMKVGFRQGLLGMVKAFSPWTLAIAGATFLLVTWFKKQQDAKRAVDELSDGIDAQTGALTAQGRATLSNQLANDKEIQALLERGVAIEDLVDAIYGNEEAQQRVNAAVEDGSEKGRRMAKRKVEEYQATIQAAQGAAEYKGEIDEATGATEDAIPPTEDYTEATEGATGAIEEEVAALSDLFDELFKVARGALDVRGAENAVEAAIDAATESVKENGATLDKNTEKGRANREALDNIADSALDLVEAQAENGASTDEMRETMELARKKFLETADAMGLEADEAEALADELGLIPDDVDTTVKVHAEQALTLVEKYKQALANIPKGITTVIEGRVIGPGFSGRLQHGGAAQAGRTYLVGEAGPELLTMGSQSGFVTPNDQLGGIEVNVMLSQEAIAGIAAVEVKRNNQVVRRGILAGAGASR